MVFGTDPIGRHPEQGADEENAQKEHPAFTSVANNLVNVYRELGRYEEAQQLLDEVLENAEKGNITHLLR